MSFKSSFFLSFLILFLVSCSKEDKEVVQPTGKYTDGVLVLNEGTWGQGNASVTYLDNDLQQAEQNVFSANNAGLPLGDVAQDLGFYEELAFIVVNASNKVEIVNRADFKSVATIGSGLDNPRYISFANDKAFITNWGDSQDATDDFVAVFDADNFQLLKKISVPEGPEKIISEGDQVYVAHKGGGNFNDEISVIDVQNNTLKKTISVGDVPTSLLIQGETLWVLSSGRPSYATAETPGSISKINLSTLEVTDTFTFPEATDHPSHLVADQGQLFYHLDNEIYSFSAAAAELPAAPVLSFKNDEGVLYSFEAEDNQFFAGFAAADYVSNGSLKIYNSEGAVLETFTTGIGPNGIFFNQY